MSEHSPARIVLELAPPTNSIGYLLVAGAGPAALWLWPWSPLLAAIPGSLAILGLVLATLRREIVVDRAEGTLVVRQRVLGIHLNSVVPLLHLSAVVVAAQASSFRGASFGAAGSGASGGPGRYVAFVRRRVGGPIYLDEARHCQEIFELAEAVAEVAELRFEYDASARHAL